MGFRGCPKKELSKYSLCLYRQNKIIIHRKIILLEISMGKIKSKKKLVYQKRNIQKKHVTSRLGLDGCSSSIELVGLFLLAFNGAHLSDFDANSSRKSFKSFEKHLYEQKKKWNNNKNPENIHSENLKTRVFIIRAQVHFYQLPPDNESPHQESPCRE